MVGIDLDRCAERREWGVGKRVAEEDEEEEIEERGLRVVLNSLAVVGTLGFAEYQTLDAGNSGMRCIGGPKTAQPEFKNYPPSRAVSVCDGQNQRDSTFTPPNIPKQEGDDY